MERSEGTFQPNTDHHDVYTNDFTPFLLSQIKLHQFRLASSGLTKVLYLIEDHDVENQMRKFGTQIQTALSSSQVVEGFFVERTSGLAASIDYLASMDSIMRKIHEVRAHVPQSPLRLQALTDVSRSLFSISTRR